MAKTTKKTQNDKGMSALKGHWLWGALALCILLLIDLLTKVGAKVYFDTLGEANIVLIPNVLELTYTENPGMAFSMGADAPMPAKLAVVIGTAVIMLLATVYYLKVDKRRSWLRWCLVFVIAGGVGNLIDRVLFKVWLEDGGGVRDMVLMDFSVWIEEWFNVPPTNFMDFGVCNFADFFIVGGAIALLLAFLFFDADAFFPVGKYKALAKEAEEAAEAKRKAKAEAKKAE
ncbi:MAG: signal peptidase II [Clostridia bacterium]|nr:signal peptidase II [Clostridia bacterium]